MISASPESSELLLSFFLMHFHTFLADLICSQALEMASRKKITSKVVLFGSMTLKRVKMTKYQNSKLLRNVQKGHKSKYLKGSTNVKKGIHEKKGPECILNASLMLAQRISN